MKERTLVFLYNPKEKRILLAMKKRGFGEGKWNGVGGKIEEGETVEEAAVREAHEEIGVLIAPERLSHVATIDFAFRDKPEFNQRVHVFFTDHWAGTPLESEEMRPKWFAVSRIPYKEMWIDDEHWLPRVLAGERVRASFTFGEGGETLLHKEVAVL